MLSRYHLLLGNRTMAFSALALLLGVATAYPFADHVGLGLQIVAHLSIAVSAGAFKLGYVIRLAAQNELGQALPQGTRAATVLPMPATLGA